VRKKIKDFFLSIVHTDGDPHKIALAVALGVFVAFFPIIGTHTVLALGLAWVCRVSPVVTLTASWLNNPWTIAPLYLGCLYFGAIVTRTDITEVNISWKSLNWPTFVELLKIIGVPFIVGCMIAGVVFAVISYYIILRMVKVYRSRVAGSGVG
jgi:uncharacterized protein (DUF2062 family)